MNSFLAETINDIAQHHDNFEKVVFVLPNKRSGIFLKRYLAQHIDSPIFTPQIHSIEEFVTTISGIQKASHLVLLFHLYEAQTLQSKSKENAFETFSYWASALLSDFSEIDGYLVDHHSLFDYLTATKRIKHWTLENEPPTSLISENLRFWEKLEQTYLNLYSSLTEKGIGYQGLSYKKAFQNIENYCKTNSNHNFIFIGFNALTSAEENIIRYFLDNTNSSVYWDIDNYFLQDPVHEAAYFMKRYFKEWSYFNKVPPKGISNNFLKKKRIEIVGIPKQIAQAKYIGHLLNTIYKNDKHKNVALVLPDETLLPAILHSLPAGIDQVNITMGLPLKASGLYSFFDTLLELDLHKSNKGWHYKAVLLLLSNPFTSFLLQSGNGNGANILRKYVKGSNLIHITKSEIDKIPNIPHEILDLLFPKSTSTPLQFVERSLLLIHKMKPVLPKAGDTAIEIHALLGYYQVFEQLKTYLEQKAYLKSIKSLKIIYHELVKSEKIDLRGEPLGGLQVMGMLESRNLDFDTVIIASVNEGILPSGKTYNSHIPHDIKKEYGLPSYKEKDAIYAYHFYRLLQRTKTIHITYNTEPDVLLGNERSRFIAQLLTDQNVTPYIHHKIATPELSIALESPKQIVKTTLLLDQLREIAQKGFSPTALSNYIKNPYLFYKRNVLKLEDVENVEETIAHNTFGTIIHDALEEMYTPFVGKMLFSHELNQLKTELPDLINKHFKQFYTEKEIQYGKNRIAFHVMQRYLESFLDFDSKRAETHSIKLLAVEKKKTIHLKVLGSDIPVAVTGKIDRIEEVDGQLQILDYKTGRVSTSELEIIDPENLTTEKLSKAFQLLCYALLFREKIHVAPIYAGIVPIKNINQGILFFSKKPGSRSRNKNPHIDSALIQQFETVLTQVLQEIFDVAIPFEDTSTDLL